MTIQLNIGLETNKGDLIKLNEALEVTYESLDKTKFDYRVTESTTEPTLVVKYNESGGKSFLPLMDQIKTLANKLDQDCIAVKVGKVGQLIYSDNPLNDWGTFNEEYFINN